MTVLCAASPSAKKGVEAKGPKRTEHRLDSLPQNSAPDTIVIELYLAQGLRGGQDLLRRHRFYPLVCGQLYLLNVRKLSTRLRIYKLATI